MKIGIIIAIARELKAFLESGYELEIIENDYRIVYKTMINDNQIYATQSGSGQIDAAAANQYLISKYNVDVVMNFGVTGALISGLRVNDLFIAENVLNHDFDVSHIDPVKRYQYIEFNDEFMPLDDHFLDLAQKIDPYLVRCNVSSGDRFVYLPEDKKQLASNNCQICDMELAAITRVCFLNKIPCMSIKCISDTFEGDGGDFQKNVIDSANRAFNTLINIIKEI